MPLEVFVFEDISIFQHNIYLILIVGRWNIKMARCSALQLSFTSVDDIKLSFQSFYIWLKSSLNSLFLSFCQNFRCIKSVDPLQANQWKENMDFAPHPYSNQIKVENCIFVFSWEISKFRTVSFRRLSLFFSLQNFNETKSWWNIFLSSIFYINFVWLVSLLSAWK